jgi:hypothetical protein
MNPAGIGSSTIYRSAKIVAHRQPVDSLLITLDVTRELRSPAPKSKVGRYLRMAVALDVHPEPANL